MSSPAAAELVKRFAKQLHGGGRHCALGPKVCGQCKWKQHQLAWSKSFPWLCARTDASGTWGVGCAWCAKSESGGSGHCARFEMRTPTALQKINFVRHEQLISHKRSSGVMESCAEDSPSTDMFAKVWCAVRKQAPDGVGDCAELVLGHGPKHARMVFCLAEGVRIVVREFLGQATCASLSQDARKQRLLSRMTATTPGLDTRSFVLGLQRDYGSTHMELCKATRRSFEQLCTPLFGAPPRSDDRPDRAHLVIPTPACDEQLFKH
eukprot:13583110-Alexandrium_andersonii.AAC.1